jgi:hypothetical protein
LLSEHPIKKENILIAERKYRYNSARAVNEFEVTVQEVARKRIICSTLVVDDMNVVLSCLREHHATAQYQGNNTWHDNRHFDIPWNEQSNYGKII